MDIPVALKPVEAVPLLDGLQRPLRELRMSVIDRCNFRCTYCMPADSLQGRGVFLPLEKLLTDHEIVDVVHAFTRLGVHKLRITGGEPLIRPGLPALIEGLYIILLQGKRTVKVLHSLGKFGLSHIGAASVLIRRRVCIIKIEGLGEVGDGEIVIARIHVVPSSTCRVPQLQDFDIASCRNRLRFRCSGCGRRGLGRL